MCLVIDIIVLLGDRLVFSADLVIDNLEVDLVALRSEAVNYGVVSCNAVLVLLGIEGVDKDCVGLAIIDGQYVLITSTSPDEEASNVVYVNIGYRFDPNVHFV